MLMERIREKEDIDVVEREVIRANGRMAFDGGGILCNWRTRREDERATTTVVGLVVGEWGVHI